MSTVELNRGITGGGKVKHERTEAGNAGAINNFQTLQGCPQVLRSTIAAHNSSLVHLIRSQSRRGNWIGFTTPWNAESLINKPAPKKQNVRFDDGVQLYVSHVHLPPSLRSPRSSC
jgi:hypothetical protein